MSYYAPAAQGRAHRDDDTAEAVAPVDWSSWDAWGGAAPRKRWADLYDEDEGEVGEDKGQGSAVRRVSLKPAQADSSAPSVVGTKSRWRKHKSRKAAGDTEETDEEPWALRRDLWNTTGPFAKVCSVAELRELLGSAQGVSILALAPSEEDAVEMWDIIKSAAQDPDAFDTALTLLCPVSDQSKPWCPDSDTIASLVPVPGSQAGKLQHVKHWVCSIGSAPPSLGTRRDSTHRVRSSPAPLQVQRAQSIVIRMTTDSAYNTASWQDVCREPGRFARAWANQLGVKQPDILDAFGFGLQSCGSPQDSLGGCG